MRVINYTVLIISIIDCVDWGLIGPFDFNLVDMLFDTGSILSKAAYILVGICDIYQLSFFSNLNSERWERIWLSAVCRRLFLLALWFIDKTINRYCTISSVVLLIHENLADACGLSIFSLTEVQCLQDGRI